MINNYLYTKYQTFFFVASIWDVLIAQKFLLVCLLYYRAHPILASEIYLLHLLYVFCVPYSQLLNM